MGAFTAVFGRDEVTLRVIMSIGQLVGRSVGRSAGRSLDPSIRVLSVLPKF